ncbi:MAG TPA: hypothetical protein VLG46_00055, partial [Anaerolineae bacterium]|nr:hypothetical protein [Anaerolineae bacterium]
MTWDEFKRTIEDDFGPIDSGMRGELVEMAGNMMAEGKTPLSVAVYHTAPELRDTRRDIQRLGAGDLDLDEEGLAEIEGEAAGDDGCDNCMSSDVACSQTCPGCGAVLCPECAVENEGRCANCDNNAVAQAEVEGT